MLQIKKLPGTTSSLNKYEWNDLKFVCALSHTIEMYYMDGYDKVRCKAIFSDSLDFVHTHLCPCDHDEIF